MRRFYVRGSHFLGGLLLDVRDEEEARQEGERIIALYVRLYRLRLLPVTPEWSITEETAR
jgi:hypothetical protein